MKAPTLLATDAAGSPTPCGTEKLLRGNGLTSGLTARRARSIIGHRGDLEAIGGTRRQCPSCPVSS
jgi:hypothetical protein